jgi:GT2 family glycosyltransferase
MPSPVFNDNLTARMRQIIEMLAPDQSIDASVVIVSFNTRNILRECLQELRRNAGEVSYETIVVDNASRDGSPDMMRDEFSWVRLVCSPTNLGFAAANNRGFAMARGRYVVLLNSDAFLHSNALKLAVDHMDANPEAGLGGGLLVGRDGNWTPSARMFPSPLNELLTMTGLAAKYKKSRFFGRMDRTWADPLEPCTVDWVPGAFSIVRRELLKRSKYFDERFFLYFEEVDLCHRVKDAGYSVWYWPDIVVTHIGGESAKTVTNLTVSTSGKNLSLWRMRSQLLYYRKHHGAFGAWTTMVVENTWNKIRALRNSLSQVSRRNEAAKQAWITIGIMKQAWRETRGGRVCPPTPW